MESILGLILFCSSAMAERQKLVIIMADGLRPDYLTNDVQGHQAMKSMMNHGVFMDNVHPIYPTKTYPNWYAIATGLYSESHGIVDNQFYDPIQDEIFSMSPNPIGSKLHWWSGGEPIWTTATKNGIKTAMFNWDGCQVPIGDVNPDYCLHYHNYDQWIKDGDYENDHFKIMDTIVDKFKNDQWSLALLYFEAVDANGHTHGTMSPERKQAIKVLDRVLGHLNLKLDQQKMTDQVNVMLVSDHGIVDVDQDKIKIVDISKMINQDNIIYSFGNNARISLHVKKDKIEETFQKLKQESKNDYKIYKRDKIPERFHYSDNDRIGDIVLIAGKNIWLSNNNTKLPLTDAAEHGYDIEIEPGMKTMLLASGPAFKVKVQGHHQLSNVDHYNIFCHILNLKPSPNNGSFDRVRFMLN